MGFKGLIYSPLSCLYFPKQFSQLTKISHLNSRAYCLIARIPCSRATLHNIVIYFCAGCFQFNLTSHCHSYFSEYVAHNLKISHLCYVCDCWQANILCTVGSYVLRIKYYIFCLAPVFRYLSTSGRKLNESFARLSRYCTFYTKMRYTEWYLIKVRFSCLCIFHITVMM